MHIQKKQRAASVPVILMVVLLTLASSCTKDPGEGGTSKITGKVYMREYNADFSYLIGQYWAADMDVYIIYGDGVTPSDRIRSGPDGDFEFPYLHKGKYRIYVYSADSTMTTPSGTIAIYRDIEITKNKQALDAGTITALKN
jgi:hypothetical protein